MESEDIIYLFFLMSKSEDINLWHLIRIDWKAGFFGQIWILRMKDIEI